MYEMDRGTQSKCLIELTSYKMDFEIRIFVNQNIN